MYVYMCSTKSDCSPVTVADFCIQAMVLWSLRTCFPTDRFIAEEDSNLLRTDVCMNALNSNLLKRDAAR